MDMRLMRFTSRSIIMALILLVGAGLLPVRAEDRLIVAADSAYKTIEAALDAAHPGDVIEVHSGTYSAPLVVDKTVSLIGVENPVIDGQGVGSLVLISAPGVMFSGFTLRASGQSLPHEDTGIVIQAENVIVRDNRLDDVMFGIYFANAAGGTAENNIILGKPLEESVRGDGIRVWYSHDVQLIGNQVFRGRDILIWYSDNITIRQNYIHNNRYGLHFMYNKNAVVQDNIIENNAVGAYMMYSAGLILTGNQILHNRGASGYGVALKDMDHAEVSDNIFINNVAALYLDNSPSLVDEHNTISRNFIAFNDIGLVGLPSVKRNIFQNNVFLENDQQVSVQGRGDLLGNIWNQGRTGNYWSSYIGYDRDGDGVGDIPFRAEKLFESLADQNPVMRLFNFSPASQAIDFAAAAFPTLRPAPKVIDEAPQMRYALPSSLSQPPQGISISFLAAALALTGIGVTLCLFTLRKSSPRGRSIQPLEAAEASPSA